MTITYTLWLCDESASDTVIIETVLRKQGSNTRLFSGYNSQRMYRRDKSQPGILAGFLARCLTWTRQRTTRERAGSKVLNGSLDSETSQVTGSDEEANLNPTSTLLFRKAGSEASNLPKLSPSMDTEETGFSADNPVKEEVIYHHKLMGRRGTGSEERNGNLKSTFLSQLPIEVRLLIYEYVFGSLGSHGRLLFFRNTSFPNDSISFSICVGIPTYIRRPEE